MSSYAEFYVKNGKNFIQIGSYGRGSEIYQAFKNYIPYGEVKPIAESTLEQISAKTTKAMHESLDSIKELEAKRDRISNFNNSVTEKLEVINEYDGYIFEAKSDYDALVYADNYVDFLINIIYSIKYGENEEVVPDQYIYAGIDVEELPKN